MFLYSRLWYRTAVSAPFAGVGGVGGYREVEKEVAAWVFRGRQEVSEARLKDAFDQGGAQLLDIGDRVRAQRVGWLAQLLAMPPDAFPRVLAGALIGEQGVGIVGWVFCLLIWGGLVSPLGVVGGAPWRLGAFTGRQ